MDETYLVPTTLDKRGEPLKGAWNILYGSQFGCFLLGPGMGSASQDCRLLSCSLVSAVPSTVDFWRGALVSSKLKETKVTDQ